MYKYISKNVSHNGLNEIQQASPMRYKQLVLKEEELIETTGWLMCTDYLNDIVLYNYAGIDLAVHGFENNVSKFDGDFFLALKGVGKEFDGNLPVINSYWRSLGHQKDAVELVTGVENVPPATQRILRIPREFTTNSAYLSMIAALIRACTYSFKLRDISDIFKTEPKFRYIEALGSPRKETKYKNIARLLSPEFKHVVDGFVSFWTAHDFSQRPTKQVVKCPKDVNRQAYWPHYDMHNAGILGMVSTAECLEIPELAMYQ